MITIMHNFEISHMLLTVALVLVIPGVPVLGEITGSNASTS